MFGQQVGVWHHVGAAIVVVWHCMGVYQVDEHSQHDCKSVHHTFTATCRQVSCLRFRFSAESQAMFGHQVGVWHHVGAAILVVWHCMGV